MSQDYMQDGWDHEQLDHVIVDKQLSSIRYRGEKGLSILQSKHHSLEPDMIGGWRPKLPSCPLPLSYPNAYVDSLISHLTSPKNELYDIAYTGPRYVNSVQINQQYQYSWKYRDRYSLNLAIVQDAIRKIGHQNAHIEQQKNKIKGLSKNSNKGVYTFDSAFESGNLDLAVKVKRNQYDCFIRSDTNTKGHTNWYYFKVQNNSQVGPIKINICNMTKCRNLYSKGMKPYTFSNSNPSRNQAQNNNTSTLQQQQNKWTQQQCYDVNFVQRYCRYGFDKKTNQLQFCYNFTKPNQTVYFAYSIPYTFTQLQHFIKQIKHSHPKLVHCKKLCESLGGIEIPLLTITNPQTNSEQVQNSPINEPQQASVQKKKAILIAARIHPGQSNSSHMMQGFIRELLQDTQGSSILRTMFVFYIVPMINPDGVIAGNFRTSYSGKDLNRQFNRLNKFVFPEITALCQFCEHVKKSSLRGFQFYFDFHGHSAKKNLFCYGPEHPSTKIHFFKARALAKIIQKISPIFSYRKSIFSINEQKKNTGRAYMLKNMKIPMTFTFQISNGLYENENKKDVFLNRSILLNAGQIVLKGLYRYAQLEMKIPKKCIKAKVDTGNIKQRHLNSAGASRRGDALKKKISSQGSDHRLSKGKSVDKSVSIDKIKSDDNKQFLALMKQIKKQQQQMKDQVQIQGGSDSESDDDDFNKEETDQLFQQIVKRNNQNSYGYIIRQKKKIKAMKLNYKKKQNQQEDLQNTFKQAIPGEKKFRSTRMIEMSRPPIASIKNIKRGVSVQYEKVVLAQKNFTMLL